MEQGQCGGNLEVKAGTAHEAGELSAGCRVVEVVGATEKPIFWGMLHAILKYKRN